MASLALIIICVFYVFIISHPQSSIGKQILVLCNSLSCGDIDIKFPFGLKAVDQDSTCSYYPNPSFQLSCDNQTRTILSLPNSRNIVVKSIDYETQRIQVNDPEGCLAKRYLYDWNLSGSPFILNPEIYQTFNLTFLRCPSSVIPKSSQLPLEPISCLSSNDDKEAEKSNSSSSSSSVIVSWAQPIVSSTFSGGCEVIKTALVPLPWMEMPMWPFWPDLNGDLGLVWTEPSCGNCAFSGQLCGFTSKDRKSLQKVGCFPSPPNKGLSRRAKYSIFIGVGLPGLLCLIGLSCLLCRKIIGYRGITRRGHNTHLSTINSLNLEPITPFVMGLDVATIDKYPKTLLGESGRLLKPSDNTCSICLSEYEPKEILRSIPECNHYFHAACIDEWLRMNGTCPICRNSPETSSMFIHSFSSLLSPTSVSTSR